MSKATYPIFVLILISCQPKESNRIMIELSPEVVRIDGKEFAPEKCFGQLKIILSRKNDAGIHADDVIVVLRVDPKTKRGMIADVEVAMRKLNIRRVEYTVLDERSS